MPVKSGFINVGIIFYGNQGYYYLILSYFIMLNNYPFKNEYIVPLPLITIVSTEKSEGVMKTLIGIEKTEPLMLVVPSFF